MRRRSDYITDAARTAASILGKREAPPDAQAIIRFFAYMLDAEKAEREGWHGDALRMLSFAYHNAELNLGRDVLLVVSDLLDKMKTCSDRRCETGG